MAERRLITAALPYINNIPHLGNIIGSHFPADIFARYCRLKGYETLFVGGTDENGSTSEIAAEKVKIDIKTFSDKLYKEHKKIYDWLNISYDNFSRTSKKIHHETTQSLFNNIYKNKFISEGKMKVFYSPKEDRFLPDRYVEGKCAICGYEKATGDQCEKCTTVLDVTQLINPKSVTTGDKVEIREVPHLFLRLDKLSSKLKSWITKQKHWRPQVTNLALAWIKEGLKERCITRDLKHGVKVPLEKYKDKVFYVWFDAPIGYISFTKEISKDWEKFWKDKKSKIYHFLGKDNIPFHTIFWPGMLIANGEFNLPYHVEGLQYLNYEGQKFSKSKKIGVFCEKLSDSGLDSDLIRAYLTLIIPENGDSEFKWKEFQTRINSEIIGNYGNFINRTLTFISNKLDSTIEKPSKLTKSDKELLEVTKKKVKKIEELFEKVYLREAFMEILSLSSEGNKYFNDNEPWKLVKEDISKTKNILYICANLCRTLSTLMEPFIPNSSNKVWNQLSLKGKVNENGNFDSLTNLNLPQKHKINSPSILFNKIEDLQLEELRKKLADIKGVEDLFK